MNKRIHYGRTYLIISYFIQFNEIIHLFIPIRYSTQIAKQLKIGLK